MAANVTFVEFAVKPDSWASVIAPSINAVYADRRQAGEASSPLTPERYTLCTGRCSYGLEFTTDQIRPNRPDAVTEIDGLYLAGASTVWGHGIAGVIRGGVHATSAILHRDLMAEIRAGAVFGEPSRLAEPGPDWDPWLVCRRLADKSRRRERALAGATPGGR